MFGLQCIGDVQDELLERNGHPCAHVKHAQYRCLKRLGQGAPETFRSLADMRVISQLFTACEFDGPSAFRGSY